MGRQQYLDAGYRSEFKTCWQAWEEQKKESLSKTLAPEHKQEVDALILELVKERKESDESWHHFCKTIFPLQDKIREFWKSHGYSDLFIRENGRIGLKALDGSVLIPPLYEDINLTYDQWEFFYSRYFVVRKDGKWGVIDKEQKVLIPFRYDLIFRKPNETDCFIMFCNGKQGMSRISPGREEYVIPCTMDAIWQVDDMQITLFTKDGFWGWWWEEEYDFYNNYQAPFFDEILIPSDDVIGKLDDEDDEFIGARKGDIIYDILYWTPK